jgi:oligoribonuclease (3'-5' exoribonuclease)
MTTTEYNELDYVCALDLETGGLNEQGDQVLEVAARFGRITLDGWKDSGLAFQRVLPLIADVRAWHPAALEMHAKNGLLIEAMAARKGANQADDCSSSFAGCDRDLVNLATTFGQTLGTAESRAAFPKARITLLGNSVHFDLRFVRRVFPDFARLLSHRVIDVSAIRLFCQSLGMPKPKGEPAHRAMADVDESLRLFNGFRKWASDKFVDGPKHEAQS